MKCSAVALDLTLFPPSRHGHVSVLFESLCVLRDIYGSLYRGIVCFLTNSFLLVVEKLNCFEVFY